MGEIIAKIGDFLSASSVNVVLKIVLSILVLIGVFIYWRYKNKMEIEAARREEQRKQTEDKEKIVEENRTDTGNVQSDSDKIDDYLKGGE